jgi:hypothetical protein
MTVQSLMATAAARRLVRPIRHPSAKKLIRAKQRDRGFLSLFGYDRDFDFALFDIEHCVCCSALQKNYLVLTVIRNGTILGCGLKECRRIKPQFYRFLVRCNLLGHLRFFQSSARTIRDSRSSHPNGPGGRVTGDGSDFSRRWHPCCD